MLENYTAIIFAGTGFNNMIMQNTLCRESKVKMIGCDVKGVCGFIFDDFLHDFEVSDADGEIQNEVRNMNLYKYVYIYIYI